ncbi:MAG: zf-TFIIB domain-containing protein [Oligoflexia bacterium]|nr:zf-TFIIB domain-containing protein [Oligoflexia bacterium]
MKCPTCKEPNLVISERQGIEIDYCPDCRGIWLDRGELDKILERSRAPEPATVKQQDSDYRDRSNYRDRESDKHYKYKRKKSFFEELFD